MFCEQFVEGKTSVKVKSKVEKLFNNFFCDKSKYEFKIFWWDEHLMWRVVVQLLFR